MNAYWAVISCEGEKAITDAAFVGHIKDEVDLTDEWKILAKTLRNKQGARNNLAHGTIVTQRWNTKRGPKSDTFLAPRYHSQKLERKINKQNKVDPRPKSRYPLKNIISERNDFHKLMIDLWEFSDRLHQRIQSKREHAQDITIRARVGRYVLPPDNQKPRKK